MSGGINYTYVKYYTRNHIHTQYSNNVTYNLDDLLEWYKAFIDELIEYHSDP